MIKPLFSIITVTYNAGDVIRKTVESVATQSCSLFEHLIIDGNSSDDTLDIARAHGVDGIRINSEPDNGIYDAMNRGLDMAEGDYVIFLNAGDKFHDNDVLTRLADAIMANDYPGIVYGQTLIVDNDGNPLADRHLLAPHVLSLESFKNGMSVCHQSFVALRKITGKFDLRYRFSADYDWCIRCLQHSRRNLYIDGYLVDYQFEGATTRNRRRSLMERFRIMSTYYGLFPTLWRHILFLPRYLRRRKLESRFAQNALK